MPKISIPCPGNTQLLPTSLVTFGNILYFLLSFLFTFFSPSYLLDQVLGWQVLGFGGLCVVIDCLAGETRQLAVVTTVCHNIKFTHPLDVTQLTGT